MNLKEIKRIAESRTKGKWEINRAVFTLGFNKVGDACGPTHFENADESTQRDAEFIAMASNKFDRLLAVVEAAKFALEYGFDSDLERALEELEADDGKVE